ncbi:MAG: PD40 domain-containing protein, partial [Planctomycetes bacterium]|nr:PD40 domain-containing protein [Planctomycetota bacterium]
SPLTRDFRTWKRYEGGWAQDLSIFDFAKHTLEPVAHSKRSERDPMWIENHIYFVSDRDGHLNLFEYDVESKQVGQLTKNDQFDVRWASRGEDGEIVYELAGELRVFDTKTKADRALSIFVPDDGVASRPSRVEVGGRIEDFGLSPKGERVVASARGDVFTLPVEKGNARNLTNSSNAHDRGARWSPDGKKLAFVSDKSGEEQLWLVDQDGSGKPEALTTDRKERLNGLLWSPDGKRITFTDKSGRIWMLDVATKVLTEVARDRSGNAGDTSWSSDSNWLAFSLGEASGFRSIHVWNANEKAVARVTDPLWNATEPVWDPNGNYLYYFSDREFAPQLMGLEWNFCANRTTGIFALALRRDVKHPFPPESDEVTVEKEGDKKEEKKEDAKKEEPKPLVIDLDGLAARVARVPVDADNYGNLQCNKDTLFYVKSPAGYYGRDGEGEPVLMAFALKDKKASALVEGVGGYTLSQDGTKLLARAGGDLALFDASSKGKDSKKAVSTKDMTCDRVPKEEWKTAFAEVWRRFRDYFYAPNMHGYDWEALRKQYAPLVDQVGHRSDLNYVIGEMVAELNVGHAYVTGGDWERPERVPVALFGGRLELDPVAGRYKLARILRGQNEESKYRSPLTEVGVDVKVGDYVLAIDGVELGANENPYRLLRGKAHRTVEWTVNSTPSTDGARKIAWRPITSEESLFYLDYVLTNRERVEQLSGGRIGYLHIPDMGADGIYEFIKWYYGQVRKDGLIVDDRNNGGGNVSQMVLERLRRVLLGTEYSRNSEFAGTYPQVVFTGPMACLLNENSASDGDIFPWMFKAAKLGPVIGKRSWGGVVGITDHGPLIDGGTVNVPEFGHADGQGNWAVEGHGVDPDIVVENDARAILDGRDPQLERGVQEVLKAMETRKGALPPRPADPVKTK